MPAAAAWSHFPHGADIGVRGEGPTAAAAFEQAALALTGVMLDPRDVAANEAISIACSAPDLEILLVQWLNALVYEMAVRGLVFGRFELAIREAPEGLRLEGRAWGEPVRPERHHPAVEVKGATFTALRVAQEDGGRWLAQTVVDV